MVSIDSETVEVLRVHQRQQAEERQAAGSAWTDNDGLVFTTEWGEPLYPDTVTALMTKLISTYNKSVGVDHQNIRHSRATALLRPYRTLLLSRSRDLSN